MKNGGYSEVRLEGSTFFGPQNRLWATSWGSPDVAGLTFQPHSGQQTVLLCSNAVHADFNAHIVLKQQKPLFP